MARRGPVAVLIAVGAAAALFACASLDGLNDVGPAEPLPAVDANAPDGEDARPSEDGGGDGAVISVCGDTATSPTNCGACGHDCLGGACVAGKCGPLQIAGNQPSPTQLAVGSSELFWINDDNNGVVSCPKTGCAGAPKTMASGGSFGPTSLVTDGLGAIWVGPTTVPNANTAVYRSLGDPIATALFTSQAAIYDLAATSQSVFAVVQDPLSVKRCGVDGCNKVASAVGGLPNGGSLAVLAPNAFAFVGDKLLRCPLTGCTTFTGIATVPEPRGNIVAADGRVIWASSAGITWYTPATPLPATTRSAPTGALSPSALAVSGSRVVFTAVSSGTPASRVVATMDLADPAPTVEVVWTGAARAVGIDADAYYWTQTNEGLVMRQAR